MIPRPVMTNATADNGTPLLVDDAPSALLGVGVDVVDGLLHCGDLSACSPESPSRIPLECHHQLNRVERVCAEVRRQRRTRLDFRLVHTELLGNGSSDPLFYIFSCVPPSPLFATRNFKARIVSDRTSLSKKIALIHVHATVHVQCSPGDVTRIRRGRNTTGQRRPPAVRAAEGICASRPSRCASGSARSCRCR